MPTSIASRIYSGGGVPNRGTSEYDLDLWNRQMRGSDAYLNFMRSNGLPTDGRVRLSRGQQSALERALASNGFTIPGGMHIDQGGNLNQRNRLVRNLAIGGALGAGGYLAAPAIAGMFGSAGAGAASAAPAAGWTMPGVSAPVFGAAPAAAAGTGTAAAAGGAATAGAGAGGLATVGRMFSSPGAGLLVNTGLSLLSQRSQNRAAEQARLDLLAHNREALALQRAQLEAETNNAALDRAERQALNAEVNRLRRMELEAAEEERAYRRNREDERESRLEPYRRINTAAMQRLSSMWGLS